MASAEENREVLGRFLAEGGCGAFLCYLQSPGVTPCVQDAAAPGARRPAQPPGEPPPGLRRGQDAAEPGARRPAAPPGEPPPGLRRGQEDAAEPGARHPAAPPGEPPPGLRRGQAPRQKPQAYLIDNSALKSTTKGLGFRRSRNIVDKDKARIAVWNTTVYGVEERGGWVRVGDAFLPMKLQGVAVLKLLSFEEGGSSGAAAAGRRRLQGRGGGGTVTGEIRYDDPGHAAAALRTLGGATLHGSQISLERDPKSQDGSKLLVSGIPAGTHWQELKDLFSPIGTVAYAGVKDREGGREKGGKGREKGTGSNTIAVDWTPPGAAEKEDGSYSSAWKARSPTPVRGPAGRGRGSTLPSWMTKAQQAPQGCPALEWSPPVREARDDAGGAIDLGAWDSGGDRGVGVDQDVGCDRDKVGDRRYPALEWRPPAREARDDDGGAGDPGTWNRGGDVGCDRDRGGRERRQGRDSRRDGGKGKGKKRTGSNMIEVDWRPPRAAGYDSEDAAWDGSAGKQQGRREPKARSPTPVRGPAGRGRGSTLPSWMTKGIAEAAPALLDLSGEPEPQRLPPHLPEAEPPPQGPTPGALPAQEPLAALPWAPPEAAQPARAAPARGLSRQRGVRKRGRLWGCRRARSPCPSATGAPADAAGPGGGAAAAGDPRPPAGAPPATLPAPALPHGPSPPPAVVSKSGGPRPPAKPPPAALAAASPSPAPAGPSAAPPAARGPRPPAGPPPAAALATARPPPASQPGRSATPRPPAGPPPAALVAPASERLQTSSKSAPGAPPAAPAAPPAPEPAAPTEAAPPPARSAEPPALKPTSKRAPRRRPVFEGAPAAGLRPALEGAPAAASACVAEGRAEPVWCPDVRPDGPAPASGVPAATGSSTAGAAATAAAEAAPAAASRTSPQEEPSSTPATRRSGVCKVWLEDKRWGLLDSDGEKFRADLDSLPTQSVSLLPGAKVTFEVAGGQAVGVRPDQDVRAWAYPETELLGVVESWGDESGWLTSPAHFEGGLYCHFYALREPLQKEDMRSGLEVAFSVFVNPQGRPIARGVRRRPVADGIGAAGAEPDAEPCAQDAGAAAPPLEAGGAQVAAAAPGAGPRTPPGRPPPARGRSPSTARRRGSSGLREEARAASAARGPRTPPLPPPSARGRSPSRPRRSSSRSRSAARRPRKKRRVGKRRRGDEPRGRRSRSRGARGRSGSGSGADSDANSRWRRHRWDYEEYEESQEEEEWSWQKKRRTWRHTVRRKVAPPRKGAASTWKNHQQARGKVLEVPVNQIRFNQESIKHVFADGRKLEDLIEDLESGKVNPKTHRNMLLRGFQQDARGPHHPATYFCENNRRLHCLKEFQTRHPERAVKVRMFVESFLGKAKKAIQALTTVNGGATVRVRRPGPGHAHHAQRRSPRSTAVPRSGSRSPRSTAVPRSRSSREKAMDEL